MPPLPRQVDAASERTSLLGLRFNNQHADAVENSSNDCVAVSHCAHAPCHWAQKAWNCYMDMLDLHPLLVKCITATFILAGGDLCGQGVEFFRSQSSQINVGGGVDLPRMARFAAFGFFGAPWSHYYFHYLDHYLPPSPKPCSTRTLFKVGIDQGIQAPLLLAIMIGMLSIMKGEGWQTVKQDVSVKYWPALVANWKLWIPFSLVNIAFVKPSLRVLFVNCTFVLWAVVLSLMLNNSE